MASNLYFCKVESVFDENDGLRIKVRIPTIDPPETQDPYFERVPFCFPLLPKHLHINPRVGEMVLVILQNPKAPKGDRFFIGPVISQQCMLDYDPYDYSARALLAGGQIGKAEPIPIMNSENYGTIPDRNDIVLQGRQNTEVALKPSELRLRCGFKARPASKDPSERLLFNPLGPAYIQMKYGNFSNNSKKLWKRDIFHSEINVVADRINLLSHDSKQHFDLNDRGSLITDEELTKIYETAHVLPYGDVLVEFLKQFVRVFNTHTHPFSMMPPTLNSVDTKTLSPNWNDMLSNTIRIN